MSMDVNVQRGREGSVKNEVPEMILEKLQHGMLRWWEASPLKELEKEWPDVVSKEPRLDTIPRREGRQQC